jgi:hypothetical protein
MPPIDLSTLPSVSKMSHDNWLIAEAYVQSWRQIDQIQAADREFLETHPLNPNRRPPKPLEHSADAVHPSRQIAQQQIVAQPSGAWEAGERQGYHWGWFVIQVHQVGAVRIALDADTRESALKGHQALQLLCQDGQMVAALLHSRVERVRLRQELSQLGYCDGAGAFSLRTTQSVPQMAVVAAHQIGHLVYGADDAQADQYAEHYAQRNEAVFRAWQAQSQSVTDPKQVMQQGLELVKRHLPPQDYAAIKGYRLSPNAQTAIASPDDVATHLTFVRLQQNTERQLHAQGVPAILPLDMPNCISHRAVHIRPPAAVQTTDPRLPNSVVQPIARHRVERPADHEWIPDPTLLQRSQEYPRSAYLVPNLDFSTLAEGGRAVYRGIVIVGTRRNCEAVKQALEECWADEWARQLVWSQVRVIYASQLEACWGLSGGNGEIVVNPLYPHPLSPQRDSVHVGSTIVHEALHEARAEREHHPQIRLQQNAFCERRYQANGDRSDVLPYRSEDINRASDF